MQNNGDDKSKSPKKSAWKRFWKAWCDWWRLTWESYVVEVQDRILMSWKRIYKFLGITIIPILYGVICSVAIWNPVEEIGRAQTIIMDNDYSVLLASDGNEETGQFKFGAVSSFNTDPDGTDIAKYFDGTGLDMNKDIALDPNTGAIAIKNSALKNDIERNKITAIIMNNAIKYNSGNTTNSKQTSNGGATFNIAYGTEDNLFHDSIDYQTTDAGFSLTLATGWEVIKAALLPKPDKDMTTADTDYKFVSPVFVKQENVALKNIKYSSNVDWNKDHWTKNAGYMQVQIPEWYSSNIINYASLFMNAERVKLDQANPKDNGGKTNAIQMDDATLDDLGKLQDAMKEMTTSVMGPLKLWSTFERNFLYGYLFNVLSGMMGSQVLGSLPSLFNTTVISSLSKYLSIDGATLSALNGDMSKVNDNPIAKLPDGSTLNYARRYDISDSTYFAKTTDDNDARLRNATMFGDLDKTDTRGVGGKFINSVKMAEAFANSDIAQKLLGTLGGQGLVDAVKELVNEIKELIDDIKKIISGQPSKANANMMQLDAKTDNGLDDAALVELNKTAYAFFVQGKQVQLTDTEKKVMTTIWTKYLGQKGDLPEFKTFRLFNENENIIDSLVFKQRADGFVKANKDVFAGATEVDQVIPSLLKQTADATFMGLGIDTVFKYKIQGAEFGIEGIGLGIFFLTVGLFVGCILLSFIFDRAKRLTKAKWSNWYISKWLLMITVSFCQVTAEVWVVYAAGWSMIGATAMCYVWLWLLFSDIMFVTIVQALWFSIKDEIIGKFLCVIVLVTSIAAGGGEFPAISEFGFFRAISYVVPFTYVIRGFDEITFGIALRGTQAWSTEFIFQQFGIELIYIAVFMTFGMLLGARFRMREMDYGSHYGFAVAGAMRALGRDSSNFQVLRKVTKKGKKRYYYNWRALDKAFDPELYFQCREMYKFAGEFKWWQRKHHDFVQKPNYSDEEIITRNE